MKKLQFQSSLKNTNNNQEKNPLTQITNLMDRYQNKKFDRPPKILEEQQQQQLSLFSF